MDIVRAWKPRPQKFHGEAPLTEYEPALSRSATSSRPATSISVAYGDGIGPEIMNASLKILRAAGANLAIEQVEIGRRFQSTGGISAQAWEV
jgi:hypothetical protein